MSIMSTLWPWKALREARKANEEVSRKLDDFVDDCRRLERVAESMTARAKHLEGESNSHRIRIALQKDEIMRLNEKLKAAPYRDPKTGRIAKRPQE